MAIIGTHMLIYTSEPEAVRAIFRDVLGYRSIGAGDGWLIFALPPAELGVHPADPGTTNNELYFLVDDIAATKSELEAKGMTFANEPEEEVWGIWCQMNLPGGGLLGFYQPKHELAIEV